MYQKPTYAFIAGELSESFLGRTDLTKYELGVKLARNFFVDYHGGLSTRAGTELCVPIEDDTYPTKMFRFRATAGDYVLLFGHLYCRPIREGGYLLEAAKTITDITDDVVTSAAHGYSSGDWVYISGVVGATEFNARYFEITVLDVNTFQLLLPNGGTIDFSLYNLYSSGGSVSRTVRITTPYLGTDLSDLSAEQKYDEVVLTSLDYARRKLTYASDTSWALALITSGSSVAAPTGLTLTPSAAASAGVAFAVTAVVDGKETVASDYKTTELTVNYTATAGSLKVTWGAVPGATEYNIYRSLVLPIGADITLAQELGYLGHSFGPQFTDNNITPDFTKTPPLYYDPFADSTITAIEMTAIGSGYAKSGAVVVTDPNGTGFVGYPVINAAGNIVSVVVVNGGSGYTAPVVSFTGGGTLATATATVGEATGNNPRIYRTFQQRGVYAGTNNLPMTIFASRPGETENMDVSSVITAGDSYEFTLDAAEVKPIRHMLALRFGLLVFTENSISLLRAEEGKAVSGINALAEPQAYKGTNGSPPVAIDLDVLFAQNQSSSLNAMMYTEYTNTFKIQDLSVLSNHLMGEGKEITRMEWVPEPHKLLYCLREDGALLTLTYEREQEVFGWAQHWTRGLFKDCCAVNETAGDVLYVTVKRKINGSWVQFVERIKPRNQTITEDFWCVDCGLASTLLSPAADLEASAHTGTGVTISASASVFSSGNVGDIIYLGGGKAEVVGYTSGTVIIVDFLRDITLLVPETTDVPQIVTSGNWEIATPISTVSGLWHLEGETVSVLSDGDAFLDQIVTNGSVTLDAPATKIKIGLPYKCQGQTLPIVLRDIQSDGRRKNVLGLAVRLLDSRGLSFGSSFTDLTEMKDRSSEDWGEELALRTDSSYVVVNTAWTPEGEIFFEQKYPLPGTVLGFVYDVDLGDD